MEGNKKEKPRSSKKKRSDGADKKSRASSESLKLFYKRYNHIFSIFSELTIDNGEHFTVAQKLEKIESARNLWIDLMMQMQENNGIEQLSTRKYYSILDQLNKGMCYINKVEYMVNEHSVSSQGFKDLEAQRDLNSNASGDPHVLEAIERKKE